MQPLSALRGYSDFFKSGFRAFTNGSSSASNLTLKTPLERRPRAVSMIVQNTPRERARRRPTSFLSFSSQWLDELSTAPSFNETSTISSTCSICSVDSGDSLPEVWITAGGSYPVPALNKSSNEFLCQSSIDPFSSSPDAESTFMDFWQDDSPAVGIPKHDFFVSFTPSSNRSSIMTHCERALSIQTSSGQQSSLQYHHHQHQHHPFAEETPDFFRVIEEEIDLLLSSEIMEIDYEDWDAPAKIDWRQFHVDVLTDDDM